ncbi:MAG: dUTP diphosphatase [Deltaproteobacteria bacterium]|nr:dUTP diphosphatase [Deltaproteobacteria bacterium]
MLTFYLKRVWERFSGVVVEVKRLSDSASFPSKSHIDDAGWDLYAAEAAIIAPGATRIIKTDIAVSIPIGWYGQIKARSGMGTKGIVVTAGVVDSGYRGNVGVVVINTSTIPFHIKPGSRVAQIVILPVPKVRLCYVEKLDESHRGNKGWGSTGN